MTAPSSRTSAAPRRVLATRNAGWARSLARWLGRIGVRPNPVSLGGIVFALGAAAAFHFVPTVTGGARIALLLGAAAGIQLRLLCNLLDGLLAVEGGFKSKTGDIYNELPDRLADIVILAGAGYAVRNLPNGLVLGWAAAVFAVLTAYVRILGGSLGLAQHFTGPMAKQHRMFVLTLACILSIVETAVGEPPWALLLGLAIIILGSVITAIRRTVLIVREMEAR